MSVKQNKAVMRSYIDEHNTTDLPSLIERIDEFFTSDYVLHHPGSPDLKRGTASFEQYVQNNLKEISELHMKIDDMLGEGDELAVRLTYEYRQASTGKLMSFSSISIINFSNGKMAEEWEVIMPDQEPDKKT